MAGLFWEQDDGAFEAGGHFKQLQPFRQEGDILSDPRAFLVFCLWKSLHTSSSQIFSVGMGSEEKEVKAAGIFA